MSELLIHRRTQQPKGAFVFVRVSCSYSGSAQADSAPSLLSVYFVAILRARIHFEHSFSSCLRVAEYPVVVGDAEMFRGRACGGKCVNGKLRAINLVWIDSLRSKCYFKRAISPRAWLDRMNVDFCGGHIILLYHTNMQYVNSLRRIQKGMGRGV